MIVLLTISLCSSQSQLLLKKSVCMFKGYHWTFVETEGVLYKIVA